MIEISDLVENERKKDKIKASLKDLEIGMSLGQLHCLSNVVHLFMEYAEWMYQKGKSAQ